MGRKHCGKRRNCSLKGPISPFTTVLLKDLYNRHVKSSLVWERVKAENIVGKGENAGN